ncbi:MAG: tyrosine--tRNA ligase [Deltaproteobacteria bacterium]|nr:tyrosine--tRNA ligase [Deltaproteobacteria bacterium]
MKSVYDVFTERGFVEQVSNEMELRNILQNKNITCYIGFDPTATSLHIGSLVPIMALMHMQKYDHRPIILIGGGTGLIGDPSGKSEMRQILTRDEIDYNASCLKSQLSKYMDFKKDRTILLNNAEWLTELKYIEFLRDIGRHFSVNKMLAAESYRIRLETGLNFIEFNYMLLQAYDFLYLFKNYGCVLQMGGNDQWGNMLAGSDLIRRIDGRNVFSMTFPLITTSHGHKMGKTERGTVWLDPKLTSPYEYYQFWINTDDSDVERFLALFTFLPMEEVREVRSLADSRLNMAKAVLAFEATKITHGQEAAIAAWMASATAFNTKPVGKGLFPSSNIPREDATRDVSAIPSTEKSKSELERGIPAFKLACETGLAGTSGDARRLIAQGGIYVNDRPVERFDEKINISHLNEHGEIHLRKGKKKHVVITVK